MPHRHLSTLFFMIFFVYSSFGFGQTSHVWAADCGDCESSILNPGWYSDGSGIFVEALHSEKVLVTAGVSLSEGNFVVALGFGVDHGGTVHTNPFESVTIETDSAPHMVLHPLSRPDSRIPKKDVSVKKQFADRTISLSGSGSFAAGYLFFPSDPDATMVTVVISVEDEVFRLPFARNPTARAKFGSPYKNQSVQAPSNSPAPAENSTSGMTALPTISGDQGASPEHTNASQKLMNEVAADQTRDKIQSLPSGSCSKNISFAVAEGGQVTSRVPKFTKKWTEKNVRKYPGLCFSQEPNPHATNYVIVFSTSQSAFNGIYPTVHTRTETNTTPVSGSGTITSASGRMWNYTYQGTETTTTTTSSEVNLPYTDTTTGLFAYSYNQYGTLVSRRWRTITTREGGDGYNTLGYNLGSALASVHIRERLLKSSVEDIVK